MYTEVKAAYILEIWTLRVLHHGNDFAAPVPFQLDASRPRLS